MTISVDAYCKTMFVKVSNMGKPINNLFEQLVINYGSEVMQTAFFNMQLNSLTKDTLIVPVSYRRHFELELEKFTNIIIAINDCHTCKFFFANPTTEELSTVEVHLHTLLLLQHANDFSLALKIVKKEYQYEIAEDSEILINLTHALLKINIPSLSQSTLTTLAIKPLTFFVPMLNNL